MSYLVPTQDTSQKIVEFIKLKGPSLPIHISKHTGLNTILSGAFLSSLAGEKIIKISNMKVGGSPLYFLPGQEPMLENFFSFLPGKEKEALLLLKGNGVLFDSELEPAIRVALRSIKDFAIPFSLASFPEKIFWKFFILPENEAMEKAENKIKVIEASKPEIKPEIKLEKPEARAEEKMKKIELGQEIKPEIKLEIEVEEKAEKSEGKIELKQEKIGKPETKLEKIEKAEGKIVKEKKEIKLEKKEIKLEKTEEKTLGLLKQKKEKPKDPRFLEEVKKFLLKRDIELIEERFFDKKEVVGKVRVNSDFGKIMFLLIALDKKKATEADLIKAYQKAISEKMPCYFVSRAEIKKNSEFLEQYKNLIKMDKII